MWRRGRSVSILHSRAYTNEQTHANVEERWKTVVKWWVSTEGITSTSQMGEEGRAEE